MKTMLKVMMDDITDHLVPLVLFILTGAVFMAPLLWAMYLKHHAPLLIYAPMAFAAWVVSAWKRSKK